MNENSAKMLGYTKEEMLQVLPSTLEKHVNPKEIEKRISDFQTKGFSNFETNFSHKNGSEIAVEITATVIIYNNRPAIMNIVRDITLRKQAENEIIRAKEKSEESKRNLQRILDNLQDAYFQADLSGHFVFVNPEAVRMYGYESIDEMIGMQAAKLYVTAADREGMIDDLRNHGSKKDWVGQGLRKDGSTFWVSMNVQFIKDIEGQIVGTEGVVRDISERKKLENELIVAKEKAEESKIKHQSMFTAMQEGVYLHEIVYDKNGEAVNYRIIDANPVSEKYLRIKREAALGALATELYGTDSAPFIELYAKVAETGEPITFEQYFPPMEKHFSISAFSPKKGEFATIFQDITDKKQHEHELQHAKDYAETNSANITAIIEGTKESIWAFNNEYVVLYINKTFQTEFQETFGVRLESGASLIESLPEALRPFWKPRYDRVLANEQFTIEDAVDTENGTIYVQVTFTPIVKKGEVIGGSCIGGNITSRKLAERELIEAKENAEESAKKLEESERQLKLKLDYILSPDNTLENINLTDVIDLALLQKIQDSFVDATGVSSIITDLDGKPITQPSNFSGVCNLIRKSEKGRANCFKSDKIIGLKAGQEQKPFYGECYSCGFIDAGAPIIVAGKQLGIWMIGQSNIGKVDDERIKKYALEIGVDPEIMLKEYLQMGNMDIHQFENVTNFLWLMAQEISNLAFNNIQLSKNLEELKTFKNELMLAKERAEESDRLKSAFLANMSHEIRTPMNGILGFADLLKERNLSGEVLNNYISIIEKSGKRMLNIINDIVDISKIEAGLMKLDIKESNINEQIEYLYTFFKPEAASRGLELYFQNSLPSKEAIFQTDREKVYAILTNLVKNAIKYTEKGKIEFGYIRKGKNLVFHVKDTGIGIPEDRQEAIFDRFVQADISDKMARQGAGLGLSISKAFVEMLGGTMWVESQEGIGSCFYFTLPFDVEATETFADASNLRDENAMNHENPQIKGLKILIVEDDEISGMLLDLGLKQFCKEILRVSKGDEAVELCRNNSGIDLVLMDIQLPNLNGYEATRQIRQFNKDIVIIAQTAFGLAGDKAKAIEAGCNDYLSKPINRDELLGLIKKYFK